MAKIFLVGAGPGDPGLITVKGRQCLEQADVVIYDYLANPDLLKYAKKGAELIYVGKRTSEHTVDQDGINALIVQKARENKTVVRLKGGDPFIFGRGGEEAEVLANAGISYELVPGVTAGIAAPLYAGIPLTMRGVNSTVVFATGHETDDKELSFLDWNGLAKMKTVVFYMGVKNLPVIADNLVRSGMSGGTPVAVIRWGTFPRQEVITGTLSDIEKILEKKQAKPPAIVVVGEVVAMRDKLRWFEKKPLFGKNIIITRARDQAGKLTEKLSALGANVIEFPTIEIVPPETYDPLDKAIASIKEYSMLILTSVNGVNAFFERLSALKKDVRILSGISICAIGPATAKAVEERGLLVDIMPEKYVAESVIESLKRSGIQGKRFLLARALVARDVIPDEIRKAGGTIDVVPVYRTVKPEGGKEKFDAVNKEYPVDVITFTSSSTVKNFFDCIGDKAALANTRCASIGPVTSETLRSYGITPAVEAKEYTIDGLVSAITELLKK